MTCRHVHARLSAYLDRELVGHQMLAIERHLSECRSCRHELESLRFVKARLGSLADPEEPAGLSERLRAKVFGVEQLPVRSGWWQGRPAWVAAAGLAGILLAVLVSQPSHRSQQVAEAPPRSLGFDLQRDQAYIAGQDPIMGPAPIVLVSHER